MKHLVSSLVNQFFSKNMACKCLLGRLKKTLFTRLLKRNHEDCKTVSYISCYTYASWHQMFITIRAGFPLYPCFFLICYQICPCFCPYLFTACLVQCASSSEHDCYWGCCRFCGKHEKASFFLRHLGMGVYYMT